MWSPLDILNPVAKLADPVLVVIRLVRLEHEVVAVGEDFGDQAIRVTLTAHWAHSSRQKNDLCKVCGHDESNKLVSELAHASRRACSHHQECHVVLFAVPDFSWHGDLPWGSSD